MMSEEFSDQGDLTREIADWIYAQRKQRRRFRPLSSVFSKISLKQAYDVQRALIDRLLMEDDGSEVVGYKLGITSRAIQELVGLNEPISGVILSSMIDHTPARLRMSGYHRLGLEFELALRIKEDIPRTKTPYSADTIAPFIDAYMPAFEIIDDRDADYSNLEIASLVADNVWAAGVVLGPPNVDCADLDFEKVPVELLYNNEPAKTAVTGVVLDNPLNSLCWLASRACWRGRPLKAGMIVMTGSTFATRHAAIGDRIRYSIERLGEVCVDVV